MTERWIRGLARMRWIVLAAWIVITAAAMLGLPDLQAIVRQTEQKFVPSTAESVQAKLILNRINPGQSVKTSAILAFSREGGLTDTDKAWLKGKIDQIKQNQSELNIKSINSAYDNPELSGKFRSKDGTTELAIIGYERAENDTITQESVDKLSGFINDAPQGSQAVLTGGAPISKDFQKSSEDGLAKTEMLTLILVLAILLVVFRSPVAPLIPLITIGISLVITRGLVAFATDYGMPVSSFTESFLIAVMFGAGTDYCILLIQRYREELSRDGDKVEALVRTMRTVGKTVIFSASTVFVAFFLIGFAKFGLYQSAVGVSIGVAVTLLAGLTLTPALLMIFGRATFWPPKVESGKGHGESRIWAGMASLASRRPLTVLLIVVIVFAPLTLLFHGKRSFDDIAEINPSLSSVQGFRQVERSFGSGEVFPVTVALTSAASMRTPEALAALEKASADVAALDGVKEVRSAVRPLGEQLKELTVSDQLTQTSDALDSLRGGVVQVAGGLDQADGEIRKGIGSVDELTNGLSGMAAKTAEAQDGLTLIHSGLTRTGAGLSQIGGGLKQSAGTAASMAADLDQLLASHPELKDDAAVKALIGKQQGLSSGLNKLNQGMAPLTSGLAQITPSTGKLAAGLGQLAAGQNKAAAGTSQLKGGLGQLAAGLKQGADGLGKVSDGLSKVKAAQSGIAENGTKQIAGWYLPQEALQSDELQQALDAYVSKDGKTAKMDVVLSVNPYSASAMDTVIAIRSTLKQSLAASSIASPDVKLSGTTAQIDELKDISQDDFTRTGALVLIGIYIVLALLLRSILAPLYVLLSLGFNYLVTMGIVEFIFVKLLDKPGLSWSASFFIFLIIVALGVDYSIFLMARFKEEYRPGGIASAMSKAMTTTGGVIISAAVIMGGTFAALMMSGVTTLLQIGAGIVIGLLLYSTVFMGLVVPALANLLGEANWWPFRRKAGLTAAAGPATIPDIKDAPALSGEGAS